jgi:hypothetical protein
MAEIIAWGYFAFMTSLAVFGLSYGFYHLWLQRRYKK